MISPAKSRGALKILFIKFSAIGDIVQATPALRALKTHLNCHITVLTVKDYAGLFGDCPYVDEILVMERPFARPRFGITLSDTRRWMAFLGSLRKKKFDAVVNYQQNARSFLVELFAQRSVGARLRAGIWFLMESLMPASLKRRRQRGLITAIATGRVPFRPALYYDPNPLSRLGITEYDTRTEFFLNDNLRDFAKSLLKSLGVSLSREILLIGINPGVNWETKRYFEERYAEVANALIEQRGATILIFGGPDDVPKAEAVLAGIHRRDRAVSIAGRTPTPNHAAAVIAHCSLFITNDTGLMHLASALGVPTVSIFGGTHPALHAPRAQPETPHIHLSAGEKLPCWPCYRYHCHWDPDRACFFGITADRVLSAAFALLGTRARTG